MKLDLRRLLLTAILLFPTVSTLFAQDGGATTKATSKLEIVFEDVVEKGTVLGAQTETGNADGPLTSRSYGHVNSERMTPVDQNTLFLVASVSKPIVATSVMRLVQANQLTLDDPVDKWIPEFSSPKLKDGKTAVRSPTIRELMAHRSGIYPNDELWPARFAAVRDFTISLEESVTKISSQPFSSRPGKDYAYSCAGYCVLGRCCEIASGMPYEEVFLTQVCKPLGLEKTTFFPKEFADAVAVPGTTTTDLIAIALNPKQHPHWLGDRHRMTHTSAGVYSTAKELGAFARMMLNRGQVGKQEYLSKRSWIEITKQPFPGEAYGMGWRLQVKDGKVTALSHSGGLVGYRSKLHIDLNNKVYKVALFTLPSLSAEVPEKLTVALLNRRIIGVVFSKDQTGQGVLVERVLEETPAATAGIKAGDRVLKVARTKVANVSQANAAVRDGDNEMTIIVLRNEQEVELSVRFEQ